MSIWDDKTNQNQRHLPKNNSVISL